MLDVNDDLKIMRKEYIDFQLQFMSSMASIFNYAIDMEEAKTAAGMTFDKISNMKDFMTEQDLLKLRMEEPQLLKWLHKPEQYIREQNRSKSQISYV